MAGVSAGQRGWISSFASIYYRWRDAACPPPKALQRSASTGTPATWWMSAVGAETSVLCSWPAVGEVTGVEPSPDACAVVHRARDNGSEWNAGHGQAASRAYDAASFQHALEHTAHPLEDLKHVHRALRDDGLVLIAVPNFGYWQRKLFGSYWYPLDLPRHRFHFTEQSLRILLTRAGFDAIEINAHTGTSLAYRASTQYLLFKRCVFPSGTALGIGYLICAALYPFTWTLQKLLGDGDFLHVVASKRPYDEPNLHVEDQNWRCRKAPPFENGRMRSAVIAPGHLTSVKESSRG